MILKNGVIQPRPKPYRLKATNINLKKTGECAYKLSIVICSGILSYTLQAGGF